MNELKISDYSDNFDLKEFKCPIHQNSFEYFAKRDGKFACFTCVEEAFQDNFAHQQV